MCGLDIPQAPVRALEHNAKHPSLQCQRQSPQLTRIETGQGPLARNRRAANGSGLFVYKVGILSRQVGQPQQGTIYVCIILSQQRYHLKPYFVAQEA
jgi:hypothetical protein